MEPGPGPSVDLPAGRGIDNCNGLQLAAASMAPSPAADQLHGSHPALTGHDVGVQRGAYLQADFTPAARQADFTPAARGVLITGHDATTGERMQVGCVT